MTRDILAQRFFRAVRSVDGEDVGRDERKQCSTQLDDVLYLCLRLGGLLHEFG
jgi:hypothetical protein